MNNSLDEKIREQAELFDTTVPSFGHFEHFEQRLERHEHRRNLHWNRWVIVTSVAATVAVILIFQYAHPQQSRTDIDSVTEVAAYYNSQLQGEIDKIEQKMDLVDELSRRELEQDIRAMKAESGDFAVLKKMPQEEGIAVIIWRYNAQMESLEHIQSILDKLPNQKEYKL